MISKDKLILIVIILGLIIWLVSLRSCYNNKFNSQRNSLDSVTLSSQKKDVTINRLNQKVTTQDVIITSDQAGMKKITEENFNLKSREQNRIKQYNILLQTKTNTRIDTLEVAWVDTAAQRVFSEKVEKECAESLAYYRDSFLKVPHNVIYDSSKNKDLQFNGIVKKNGFQLNSINIPDIQTISINETKGGLLRRGINGKVSLFSKKKMQVSVVHSNKYIDIQGMKSVVYLPKKGIWDIVIAVIAAASGIYLGALLRL